MYCRTCPERRADYIRHSDGAVLCKDCTPVQTILAGDGHWIDGRAPQVTRRLSRRTRPRVTWSQGGVPA